MNAAESEVAHTSLGKQCILLLKKYRFGICVVALIVSMFGNIAAFHIIKKFYAEARAAALFPSHGHRFGQGNYVLPEKKKRRIVLFGDSRIEQWKNFPASEGSELIARGVPGETTGQMRIRFERDVLALNPDIVVLQLGINDLVAIGALPDRQAEIVNQCAANMKYFVEALRTRNIRTILLTIIPPAPPPIWRLPVWSDQISAEVENLNRYWIAEHASATLHVIDTKSLLQDAQGRWRRNVTAGTLHITPRGYEYLNAAVMPLIRN